LTGFFVDNLAEKAVAISENVILLIHHCGGNVSWGAFGGGCILIRRKSLSCFFILQGLFLPAGFIPILHLCSAGIIFTGRIHPNPALLFRRDDFIRPDSS